MAFLNLFVDYAARTLVATASNATPVQLPGLFNTNLQTISVALLTQTGNPTAPYSTFNATGYTLDIVIGPTPQATTPPTLLAYIDGLAGSTTGFTGSLTLSTTGVNTFIGTAASKAAYFEMTLIDGSGNRTTIFQGQVNLVAALDTTSVTVPSPAASYLTAAQCNAAFARLFGIAGQTITLLAPGGHYARILGVDDSGNRIDDIQPIP